MEWDTSMTCPPVWPPCSPSRLTDPFSPPRSPPVLSLASPQSQPLLCLLAITAALALTPAAHAQSDAASQPDPDSEADHAAILRAWDPASLERGRRLYHSICITCHGDLHQPGSLPTARPFWLEPFKNGADPLSLYRTLTLGFGQMPAWPWLTPELRYDVIHFVRESLVKPHNPAAYFPLTEDYLNQLPSGSSFVRQRLTEEFEKGPPWIRMQLGPVLFWTLQVAPQNIAQKGIATRLDPGPGGISRGHTWMVHDHDTLRAAAAWTGNDFVDWRGIAFDGSHGTHTSIAGKLLFINPPGPGWARPGTLDFTDPRPLDKQGRPYGPLPKPWAHYHGTSLSGDRVVLHYTVDEVMILESPALEPAGKARVASRTFNIAPRRRDLHVRLAPIANRLAPQGNQVALAGDPQASLSDIDGFYIVTFPAGPDPLRVKALIAHAEDEAASAALPLLAQVHADVPDLRLFTRGGPSRWPETLTTQTTTRDSHGPFAIDHLPLPNLSDNPWNAWLRPGGFDFFSDGDSAAIAMWNGDVWRVSGLQDDLDRLHWKRIAAGLFQPLGLKIVNDVIHVACRDQIARLHDLDGDLEIDWIENFNNDHQVTEHFHEFAMGLQTDADGHFYYAKGARHALPDLVPHHGTLLRVQRDGSRTDILANGFRAPNGVCVNPDGSFWITDQEGHWHPKNRINLVQPGGFYGNQWSYGAPTNTADAAMLEPAVWITNDLDRSPGEMLRIPLGTWPHLDGALLNLSYGTGDVFLVLPQPLHDQTQGAMVRLPIDRFPTGVMRGRWHPRNGHLHVAGMFAWAGNQQEDGGFYRVRPTGRPLYLPIAFQARPGAIDLTFAEPLDPSTTTETNRFTLSAWDLRRSANYGSPHLNTRSLTVFQVTLAPDHRKVTLHLPDLAPTRGMEILCRLRSADGTEFERRLHLTLHTLQTLADTP